MREILDFEEDDSETISFADRAFIYFKWTAVFFTAGLLVSYFQVRRALEWYIAGAIIYTLLALVLLFSFFSLRLSIKSFRNKEPINYKNVISTMVSIAMIMYIIYFLVINK